MRAVNIYVLTRLMENKLSVTYEKMLSLRDGRDKTKYEEIELIRDIVKKLQSCKVPYKYMDGWFYSFQIPQISKEFDLLKIGKNNVIINLELKSQPVSEEKIEKQLLQNKYYLSHISSRIYSFTYVKENESAYQLYFLDKQLRKCSFEQLIEKLSEVDDFVSQNIELLFTPKEYLVSPLNTPEKFMNGNYYLTALQDQIKKEILSKAEHGNGLWGIKGSAGCGKTLLLYDLAKAFSQRFRVCIVHCGQLSDGHKYINEHADNMQIIDAKSLSEETIQDFQVLCIDETQRLYNSNLNIALDAFNSGKIKICIFSYDFAQVLSKTEYQRNIPERLNKIEGFQERKLTDKIRTNKEIFSFIRNMMRLTDKPEFPVSYNNIDILYANNIDEADLIRKFYRKKGYTFITFTPSLYVNNSINHYSGNINSHQVIGQEFDSVLVILDDNFRYSNDGTLQGREHPNPNYLFPRLFYQNISRAREKLCIIVLGNMDLFSRLLCIKAHIEMEDIEK